MHPHPLVLVAAHVAIARDDRRADEEEGEGEGEGEDQGGRGDGMAEGMAEGMAGVRLSDGARGPSGSQPAKPPTALLIVDRWLRFRVPLESVAQLMCLRVRLAEAFAATVRHPHTALPPVYQGAAGVRGRGGAKATATPRRHLGGLDLSIVSSCGCREHGDGRLPLPERE